MSLISKDTTLQCFDSNFN